jgi:hypothetical protein
MDLMLIPPAGRVMSWGTPERVTAHMLALALRPTGCPTEQFGPDRSGLTGHIADVLRCLRLVGGR